MLLKRTDEKPQNTTGSRYHKSVKLAIPVQVVLVSSGELRLVSKGWWIGHG